MSSSKKGMQFAFLFILFGGISAPASYAKNPIQKVNLPFFVPENSVSSQFQTELQSLIKDYNDSQNLVEIEVLARGSGFSSLNEVMASNSADFTPTLALMESSEIPAALQAGLLLPLPENHLSAISRSLYPLILAQSRPAPEKKLYSLPMGRVFPVLLVNQEVLFRHYLDPFDLPQNGSQILKLINDLAQYSGQAKAPLLGLSLNSDRGLWLLESLMGRSKAQLLYQQKMSAQSLQTLRQEIVSIQSLVDLPQVQQSKDSNRLLDAFSEGQIPLLLTFSDALPSIASRARFRWSANPLSPADLQSPGSQGGSHAIKTSKKSFTLQQIPSSGPQLVLLKLPEQAQHQNALWGFIRHLYQTPNAIRWMSAGGSLPLSPQWTKHSAWKSAVKLKGSWLQLLNPLPPMEARPRGDLGGRELLSARAIWAQSLNSFFGDHEERKNTHKTLTALAQEIEIKR